MTHTSRTGPRRCSCCGAPHGRGCIRGRACRCSWEVCPLCLKCTVCCQCKKQEAQEANESNLEKRIMEAATNNADNLLDLIQEAIERIPDEDQCTRLLDRVLQAQKEDYCDLTGWRTMQP